MMNFLKMLTVLLLVSLFSSGAARAQGTTVSPASFAEVPGGRSYYQFVTLDGAPEQITLKDLNPLALLMIVFAADTQSAPVTLQLSKPDIGTHEMPHSTAAGPIRIQTHINGDLTLTFSTEEEMASGHLLVFVETLGAGTLPDFTSDLNGDPIAPGETSDVVPASCTVDGGGQASGRRVGADAETGRNYRETMRAGMQMMDIAAGGADLIGGALGSATGPGLSGPNSAVPGTQGFSLGGFGGVATGFAAVAFGDDLACNTALLSIPALPRVPVSCPMALRAGNTCYDNAYSKIDTARLQLTQLTCAYTVGKYRIELLLKGMQGAASMGGPVSPALQMQTQVERRNALEHVRKIANEQRLIILGTLRDGLQDLGRCEAEYGDFPGWYARVGFSYESSLAAAHTYK